MIIAIAANENHLKAIVDPHFGRCDWYCLYNTETKETLFFENPARHHQEKAGCDAAELLVGKNINIAVAGRFGSKVVDGGALNILKNHGLEVYRGCSGDVRQLTEAFLLGIVADSGEGCHHYEEHEEGHVCNH